MMKENKVIDQIVKLLVENDKADSYDARYAKEHLKGYLEELSKKHDNITHGIVIALEIDLEK